MKTIKKLRDYKTIEVKSVEEEGFKLWMIGDYAFAYAPHIIATLVTLYVIFSIIQMVIR